MELEKYKIKMKQSDIRNIPSCYLRNAMNAVPSIVRDLLISEADEIFKDGKLRIGENYVSIGSDATLEIYGASPEARERILSKLKLFDIEKVG